MVRTVNGYGRRVEREGLVDRGWGETRRVHRGVGGETEPVKACVLSPIVRR